MNDFVTATFALLNKSYSLRSQQLVILSAYDIVIGIAKHLTGQRLCNLRRPTKPSLALPSDEKRRLKSATTTTCKKNRTI